MVIFCIPLSDPQPTIVGMCIQVDGLWFYIMRSLHKLQVRYKDFCIARKCKRDRLDSGNLIYSLSRIFAHHTLRHLNSDYQQYKHIGILLNHIFLLVNIPRHQVYKQGDNGHLHIANQ